MEDEEVDYCDSGQGEPMKLNSWSSAIIIGPMARPIQSARRKKHVCVLVEVPQRDRTGSWPALVCRPYLLR